MAPFLLLILLTSEGNALHSLKFAMLPKLAVSSGLFQLIVSRCIIRRWLLGYPVTYLFRNESGETATQNLSKHSLHIYRIYVVRNRHSDSKQSEEELLSFSVPCDISMKREEEPWAKSFLARVNGKLERCSQVWASVRLEIEVFQSQSGVIVL
uniref:Uncharacterized protein n=1 Tax=Aegilops tauschii subsp. strangulata TaxID=200361 RepID=A0A453LBF4_AEGTS